MSGTQTAVRVYVPWTPPTKLRPNAGAHWATKNRLRKEGRDAVKLAIRSWRAGIGHDGDGPLFPGKARISVVVRWEKGRRFMDPDNLIACLKGPVDGLVQEGVLADDSDDHLAWGAVTQERDAEGRGELEIDIEGIAA